VKVVQVLVFVAVLCQLAFAKSKPCSGEGDVAPQPDCKNVRKKDRTPPLYPKKFTNLIQGYVEFPFQANATFKIKLPGIQDWYQDSDINALKFVSTNYLGLFNLTSDFLHRDLFMYTSIRPIDFFCFCNDLGIGPLKYDAFADGDFAGRETLDVEYGVGPTVCDHYVKLGHHIWMDVETKLPVRFFQEVGGLQIYTNWKMTVDPEQLKIPDGCMGNCNPTPALKYFFGNQKEPIWNSLQAVRATVAIAMMHQNPASLLPHLPHH